MITRKRIYRFLLYTLLVLLLIAGAGAWFLVEHVLPYTGIKPFRTNVHVLPEFAAGIYPDTYGLNYEPFSIRTNDSLTLQGYLIKADAPKGTVIILHGIADCKEHQYALCKKLVALHCNALIIDLRAHGMSQGDYCTFGFYEKFDMLRLIEYAASRNLPRPYGIYGNSLGGAVALQTLGITDQLDFGIIESTFDRLDKVSVEYGEDILGFRMPALVDHVLAKSGVIAHFDPFVVNPADFCTHITCPIFMAHGTADEKIPISFGEHNFSNIQSQDKTFVRVPEAGHNNLHATGGDAYWDKVSAFILKNEARALTK
jgi:hypothetical protein